MEKLKRSVFCAVGNHRKENPEVDEFQTFRPFNHPSVLKTKSDKEKVKIQKRVLERRLIQN
jgi:hypothetical protein